MIAQIPTAQQIIPPVFDAKAADALGGAVYEFEPDAEDILHELLPRNLAVQIFRALSGKRGVVLRRADVGDGQRDAQRRRHDPPANAHL